MLALFTEQTQILKKKPQNLPSITLKLLQNSTKAHHPHNKLLPASDIQHLFNIASQSKLTGTNANASEVLLASNCLANVLKVNFNQMSQNKLYGAFVMQFTRILESINEELKKQKVEATFMYLKLIARGVVMTKIILKLLERTRSFLPEYYRFARMAVNTLVQLLQDPDINSLDLSQKEKEDILILRICFSKKVTRQYILYLLSQIQKQIKNLTKACPSSKEIQIIKEIKVKIEEIGAKLPEHERVIVILKEEEKEKKEDENVFLEEPIAVRELTPRFYDEEKSVVLTKLRRKKQKLTKKIENDLRKNVQIKQQEAQILDDVRKERSDRQRKKQMFVIEKQTSEARKIHRKVQKVKLIQKGSGKGKQTLKGRLEKLSQRRKKK